MQAPSPPVAAAEPDLQCDLVMKGGITSGVVYPRAMARVARDYRIRSIGGTSVGAIAAVLTAAASTGARPTPAPRR
jgi:predicted acylesterase/phospholipase RssA